MRESNNWHGGKKKQKSEVDDKKNASDSTCLLSESDATLKAVTLPHCLLLDLKFPPMLALRASQCTCIDRFTLSATHLTQYLLLFEFERLLFYLDSSLYPCPQQQRPPSSRDRKHFH